MVEKGSALLEIKGAAFFVSDKSHKPSQGIVPPKVVYFYRPTGRLQGFIITGGEAPTSGQPNLFHLAPF